MPFYYDLNYAMTTSSSAGTEVSQLWGVTVANQETVGIVGIYPNSRFATAGGAQVRMKHNTGTIASGGTAQTPAPKNLRGNPAAQSTWKNAGTTITPGTTLVTRMSVGFAQTGGQGGYVPITPADAVQLMPNGANPINVEFTALAASASVTGDLNVEISEGI